VDWIIQSTKSEVGNMKLKVLDIGTGSGCIAISLAKYAKKVYAIDVSEKALATAKKNAVINQVDVTFIEQNILETADLNQQFDIIVSNPPYVRNLEKQEIKKNVLDNEPHLALLWKMMMPFYKKIAALAQKNLLGNGQLYFEINQYLERHGRFV
jgi:release factor glutamine methyltransferase